MCCVGNEDVEHVLTKYEAYQNERAQYGITEDREESSVWWMD